MALVAPPQALPPALAPGPTPVGVEEDQGAGKVEVGVAAVVVAGAAAVKGVVEGVVELQTQEGVPQSAHLLQYLHLPHTHPAVVLH